MKWRCKPMQPRISRTAIYAWLEGRVYTFVFGHGHPIRHIR